MTRCVSNGLAMPMDQASIAPSNLSANDHIPSALVTVLMPCLNESRTLAACIEQAHAGCQAALAQRAHHATPTTPSLAASNAAPGLTYEILIADNGSTDGSPEIAVANDARVVHVERKGYGAALLGGIAAARGKYVVMGDSDCSYDFGEVPRFLDKLEAGNDLVMGNRFAGGIMPGAMPWHHRYIGNPILSGLGRLLYRTPCRDWHCGLRAFDREKIQALNLKAPGMEFASEMVIRASQGKLCMGEITIQLRPDGRSGPPHLRSFRDGVRHLAILLASASTQAQEALALTLVLPFLFVLFPYFFGGFGSSKPTVVFPNPIILDEHSFKDGLADFEGIITSPVPISILGARASCGCIWTEDLPLEFPEGVKKSVRFYFDPKKRTGDRANRPIDFTINFLVNGRADSLTATVTIIPTMDLEDRFVRRSQMSPPD
jgi:glycosyltransferase involved in cell wall biosynthesis